MRRDLLFLSSCFVIAVAGAIYAGGLEVAASEPESLLVQRGVAFATGQAIRVRAAEISLAPVVEIPPEEGVADYRRYCVQCHGAPGVEPSPVGLGMRPRPPDLSLAAIRWSSGELFWIIKNGLRRTGMPAWKETLSDEEIQRLVAFVGRLPYMKPKEYEMLASRPQPKQIARR